MSSVTVVLADVRGLSLGDAALVLETLCGQADRVAARCDATVRGPLAEKFPEAVGVAWDVPMDGHVLMVTAPVAFGPGAVASLVQRAAVPGRIVTRVFLPDSGGSSMIALWSAEWLTEHGIDGDRLPELGLTFDNAHLPHDHPQARAWIPADEVGVVPTSEVGPDLEAWARAERNRVRRQSRWSGVRARLGTVRRELRLLRQRRAHRRRTAAGTGVRAP
ncbi:hypothetical protein [Ruania alba]|uniref:Uncharacterized protein n=1 Tax=Ruania alba TaxID=648782 RepID=A0A1H5NAK3_9MICO|nr:hypothetical protein [Ruania alba]SEE98586.1 hypothetical protein SAMN04488554_4127 [Ruania alba]